MTASPDDQMTPPKPIQILMSQTPGKRKRRRRKKSISDTASVSSDDNNHRSNGSPSPTRRMRKHNKTVQPDLTLEEKSRHVAMDCEMVGVGVGGHRSALARVCIINWNGKKLMDHLVLPDEAITDYRTFVSGITQQDLESDKVLDMEECRARVLQVLADKILVGHALKNDLHALGITHPWYDTRDTAKYEPFMKVRFDDGILWPRKLKELAKDKLGRDVQRPGASHSAFEDAKTALDLYKLVRPKWEKAMEYKINKTREIERKLQQTICVVEAADVQQLAQ